MEHKQDKIEPLINLLKNAKPMKGRAIAHILDISERELRAIVSYTRKYITPRITSGDFGYCFENDTDRIRNSFKRRRSHAISELVGIKNQEKLLKEEIK